MAPTQIDRGLVRVRETITRRTWKDRVAMLEYLGQLIALGAVLAPLVMAATLWTVSRYFATQKDLDGVGERLTATETIARAANDTAGAALSRYDEADRVQSERWSRTLETLDRVGRTMEKISAEQVALQKEQAVTAAEQRTLGREVSRLLKRMDA